MHKMFQKKARKETSNKAKKKYEPIFLLMM